MKFWPYARWIVRHGLRRISDIWRGWIPVSKDERYFRTTIERAVDRFHMDLPLLRRDRDTALIHFLRCFEDSSRFGTLRALSRGSFQFYGALRRAHEAAPWAIRWIWDECPSVARASLKLDWETYEQAGVLFHHSYDYYHLYRCFVLYSNEHFRALIDRSRNRVRFLWISKEEMRRDAGRQIRENIGDSRYGPSGEMRQFLAASLPVVHALLPTCLERIGENDIHYRIPVELSALFRRWATLASREMRFDLPGHWDFDGYNLHQFGGFWKSLLTICLGHTWAHYFAESVGVRGGAVGSAVIQIGAAELQRIGGIFGTNVGACRAIIQDLTYSPRGTYWDPFWQPLFRLRDDTFLISPSLVMGSSPERNLIALLNRIPAKRPIYARLSNEKETAQLHEIEQLFLENRFLIRRRVPVRRPDGTDLSDIDLLIFDRTERSLLLVQAKWLVRPDYWNEVLSRDDELGRAIDTLRAVKARVAELGSAWLAGIFGTNLGEVFETYALVVNRDFLPSGWVYDPELPVVDMVFLREFVGSSNFQGLASLYAAARYLDQSLSSRLALRHAYGEIRIGDYVFELPTIEMD